MLITIIRERISEKTHSNIRGRNTSINNINIYNRTKAKRYRFSVRVVGIKASSDRLIIGSRAGFPFSKL